MDISIWVVMGGISAISTMVIGLIVMMVRAFWILADTLGQINVHLTILDGRVSVVEKRQDRVVALVTEDTKEVI